LATEVDFCRAPGAFESVALAAALEDATTFFLPIYNGREFPFEFLELGCSSNVEWEMRRKMINGAGRTRLTVVSLL
jgi:hypothetical protein